MDFELADVTQVDPADFCGGLWRTFWTQADLMQSQVDLPKANIHRSSKNKVVFKVNLDPAFILN